MSWFEEWFDSPLYEKIYADRNEEEAALLADLIQKIIPNSDYPEILDLGCGRGRHSINLANRGYHVTGVDLSEQAIKKAKRLASEDHLHDIRFLVGDMRDPLHREFDAILNLFTTFGYFLEDSENRKVLYNVSGMLKEDGIFIQDFLNPYFVNNTLVSREEGRYEDLQYEIERKIEDRMVFKKIRFTGDSLDEPVEFSERVKLYDLNWFENQLPTAGLKLKTCYGDYHGNPYKTDKSPRLIMVSTKEE
ncbi:MAG: class I SAM-dependent methyltransferase [Balneolaceae bacterium]